MTATGPPTDIDVLCERLPTAPDDLAGLTTEWHLWPGWSTGLRVALARHLDGNPTDPDARFVAVVPYAYTWAVIVGFYRLAMMCHEDRWCYHTMAAAVAAAHVWDGQDEPVGWHRHPSTGRRRENGDPTQEHIRP